jgi:methyl-accepting chemotaxis protein
MLRGSLTEGIEGESDHDAVLVPIGRSGNPLGEVRLEARYAGAFGPVERQWLTEFLQPIAAVLRVRRREFEADDRANALSGELHKTIAAIARAAEQLPAPPSDGGMAVPPPVDAREVLAQMSDGVTGIARHGEGLTTTAVEARDRARGAGDSIARGLDALGALNAEMARLSRYGDEITTSNDAVSGVAFRTNLVANNAALEATRAGAAGRTFGVLAEEVRRLADTAAATSAAIGERTAALAAEIAAVGATLESTRQALATAIREAEAGEQAAQRLSDAAVELEDTARSLRPVVSEANAVAKRRSVRDQHLTSTLERFLDERAALARALIVHRDTMARAVNSLDHLGRDH